MHQRRPGDQIEIVYRIADEPFIVFPAIVVEDSGERIANYLAAGTRYLRRQLLDGSPVPRVVPLDDLARMGSRLAPAVWRRHGLGVNQPDVAHGIRLMWTAGTWTFEGWYVNLQAPLTRTDAGFVTEDHFLDIVVQPDLAWKWKDEDELDLVVELGRVTAGAARSIRAEGERVIECIERRTYPFDGALEQWRPDPNWAAPTLGAPWSDLP